MIDFKLITAFIRCEAPNNTMTFREILYHQEVPHPLPHVGPGTQGTVSPDQLLTPV